MHSSWELIRSSPGVQTQVIGAGVLAFDLADGTVLPSSGSSITRLTPDGSSEWVLQADQIEQLVAL